MSATHPLVEAIAARAMEAAPRLAERAAKQGLAVTLPDGTIRPIPVGAIPVILSDDEVGRRRELATQLTSASAKAARWRLSGKSRDAVLDALGPAERRLVGATWAGSGKLAVARVDFLGGDELFALEVNATIPAMQGYSDIAAEAWLATFAKDDDERASLVYANGSNALALKQALIEIHRKHRGDPLSRLGLLCRRGDAQFTELQYLRDRFRASGLQADIVHPDQLRERNGYLVHDGEPLQLLYRHLFLSRLDAQPSAELEAMLSTPRTHGTLVLNRPAPHLEMKSTLAWLSKAGDCAELARAMELTEHEQLAVRSAVPWTRSLVEPGTDTERAAWIARIKQHPDDFVLKRAWSYGGSDVFVGRARDSEAFWSRVRSTYPQIDHWEQLVDQVTRDRRGGGFVVQRAIPRSTSTQILCTPTEVRSAAVVTDYAAFASIGTSPAWAGVSRAATTDVVNIVGGGAVVPVIRAEVADTLWRRIGGFDAHS